MVIIDTEDNRKSFLKMNLGYCRDIAEYSGGKYYPIRELNSSDLSIITTMEREAIFGV